MYKKCHNKKLQRLNIILLKEIHNFLRTPTLYVALALFVFLTAYLNFFVSDFFNKNEASLSRTFFYWHPWIYALIIPAITMRLWSEEHRQHTLELLITMGFSSWQLLLGKYLCAWIIIILSLTMTFPLVISLYALGPPDTGLLISSYLGSILLSGVMTAIAMFTSGVSKNQFISYVLGALGCTLCIIVSSSASMNTLIQTFPNVPQLTEFLSAFSVTTHFNDFINGKISLTSICFFVSTTIFILYIAHIITVNNHQICNHKSNSILAKTPVLLVLTVMYIMINTMSFQLYIDVTQHKQHSITTISKSIIEQLKSPITIQLYESRINNSMPYKLRTHARRVNDFVSQLERLNTEKIQIERIDPSLNEENESLATFNNITPQFGRENTHFYFGISVSNLNKRKSITFLHPERTHLLEYDLIQLIDHVTNSTKKNIGIISSLPIEGSKFHNQKSTNEFPPWISFRELGKDFILHSYDQSISTLIEQPPDLLIIVHPANLPTKYEKAIDQYIAGGGNLLLMLDPHSISAQMIGSGDPGNLQSSDLPGLLKAWGIEYSPTSVVADMQNKSSINRGFGPEDSHTVINLSRELINTNDPVTSSINNIGIVYSGYFAQRNISSSYRWKTLVSTSTATTTINSNMFNTPSKENNITLLQSFKSDNIKRDIVVKLEGIFPIAFPDNKLLVHSSPQPATIIMFADTDFIFDPFAGETISLSSSEYAVKPYNSNLALFSNAVSHLTGHTSLNHLQKKNNTVLKLKKLDKVRISIYRKYEDQRRKTRQNIERLQNKLTILSKNIDSANVQHLVTHHKQKNKLLSEIKHNKRLLESLETHVLNKVQVIKNRYQWANIFLLPLIILISGMAIIASRHYRFQ